MSYRGYAYGDYELGNDPPDGSSNFMPSDLKLDPTSNANTMIVTLNTYRGILEGQFTYNSIKATFSDVTLSNMRSFTFYDNGVLRSKEYFDPGFDAYTYFFGTYRDYMEQFSGNDIFVGSENNAGDDQLRGYTGNDTYTGNGSGEYGDSFNGEAGFDVAILRGKLSEYNIKANTVWDIIKNDGSRLAGFEVTDQKPNREGVDYYANVERLYFLDKAVALDIDGNAGQAYRLYKAALDRTPDEVGLGGWISFIDNGMSLTEAAGGFVNSSEFSTKYGALDDHGFVNRLYNNVLGRDGEQKGIDDWVAWMGKGHSRAEVLVGFSESAENQTKVLGLIQNGIAYQEWAG